MIVLFFSDNCRKINAIVDYNIEAEYLSYVWACPYV